MNPVLLMILIGLAVVSTMVFLAGLLGAGRQEATYKAIFAWFVGAAVNAYTNVAGGAVLSNELGDFVLILGIPAALAFVLARFIKVKQP
jgi:hypothetical protein